LGSGPGIANTSLYNALVELNVLHQACCMLAIVHQLQKNELIVKKYVQNVCHWHEHKHASMLAIGQLRHQSATAPSRPTYAVNSCLVMFM